MEKLTTELAHREANRRQDTVSNGRAPADFVDVRAFASFDVQIRNETMINSTKATTTLGGARPPECVSSPSSPIDEVAAELRAKYELWQCLALELARHRAALRSPISRESLG